MRNAVVAMSNPHTYISHITCADVPEHGGSRKWCGCILCLLCWGSKSVGKYTIVPIHVGSKDVPWTTKPIIIERFFAPTLTLFFFKMITMFSNSPSKRKGLGEWSAFRVCKLWQKQGVISARILLPSFKHGTLKTMILFATPDTMRSSL